MIPLRPWRCDGCEVLDAVGAEVCFAPNYETAEYVVRLANAEPEIVAALEAAELGLDPHAGDHAVERAPRLIRAILAKVRP